MSFDVTSLRRQFPFLSNSSGEPPAYLDSAATAQKPQAVIDAMSEADASLVGNIRRGVHSATEQASQRYEEARETVRRFIDARHDDAVVFTQNATHAINLVAHSWGGTLERGDTVLTTILEHHSNIVPWMQLKERSGTQLVWLHCDAKGTLDMQELQQHLSRGDVKLVTVTGQSNVLGVRPDLRAIIAAAHRAGALVLVDASQMIVHERVGIADLDCDFLVFSGHKLYGPTGIGVLAMKKELADTLPPFAGGGGMVWDVTQESFHPAESPDKFEAGTPPITQAVGLAAAIDWMAAWRLHEPEAHQAHCALLDHAFAELTAIPGLRILGPRNSSNARGCISFTLDGLHPHDVTDVLSRHGIALRAGHHCAAPLHRHLGISASTRLSIAAYTTREEIDRLREGILNAKSLLVPA